VKIVAGLIIRNECERYLRWSLAQLLEFFTVVVVDDGSTDGTRQLLREMACDRMVVHANPESEFFRHEGQARQRLMRAVVAENPDYIVATDADEFLSNPRAMWQACVNHYDSANRKTLTAWTLPMQEVWKADDHGLYLRTDGGWRSHGCPILYSVPERPDKQLQITDRALACGRQPDIINKLALSRKAIPVDAQILHFGWTCVRERADRYQRYVVADGGQFHRNSHLESIMWPDKRVRMVRREWPEGLVRYKDDILRKVNG
jgi:glycosyltransferase involved in cell wall biosynthesis